MNAIGLGRDSIVAQSAKYTFARKETKVNNDPSRTATALPGSDVIERAQNGDPDAFATLFNAHKRRIYSLCLHMTNNAAEAEELAQDAFLQVFRKIASFRGDSAFSTWLHRIAVNTVLMHFRRKSPPQISLDEPYNNNGDVHSNAGDGRPMGREYETRDLRLEASVTRVALSRAVGELPEGYRTIFLLHDVEGYEHHEIAEMLGCSVGTSKSQLHRARLRIREFLACPPEARTETDRDECPSTMNGKIQSVYEQMAFLRKSRGVV
jgi:RNA polymerase sigma-70 factor (ECF subfamily)